MGIFCIRNKWDYISWIMDHPVAVSEIQVNSGTQILFYHWNFIPVSLYHNVCHYSTCTWNAFPVCSKAQRRFSGENTADFAVDFRWWVVHNWIAYLVRRLSLQRSHSCVDTYLFVHQRIFAASLLVVSLNLLAAERCGDYLHSCSTRTLYRRCDRRLLYHDTAVLVVPFHGQ